MLGPTIHPEVFYSHNDYLILCSKYESFGQEICESLSAGTPVIGFTTIKGATGTALQELIKDGETGIHINDYSTQAIREALNKAINIKEEGKYLDMRKECGDYADNEFSWGSFVEKVLDIVDEE